MPTIPEIQGYLQNKINVKITQTLIGKALKTGRSNISLRVKHNSELSEQEIQTLWSPCPHRSRKRRPTAASPRTPRNRKVPTRRRSRTTQISYSPMTAGSWRGYLRTKVSPVPRQRPDRSSMRSSLLVKLAMSTL